MSCVNSTRSLGSGSFFEQLSYVSCLVCLFLLFYLYFSLELGSLGAEAQPASADAVRACARAFVSVDISNIFGITSKHSLSLKSGSRTMSDRATPTLYAGLGPQKCTSKGI